MAAAGRTIGLVVAPPCPSSFLPPQAPSPLPYRCTFTSTNPAPFCPDPSAPWRDRGLAIDGVRSWVGRRRSAWAAFWPLRWPLIARCLRPSLRQFGDAASCCCGHWPVRQSRGGAALARVGPPSHRGVNASSEMLDLGWPVASASLEVLAL
jgi:hypothetical protein